MKFFLLRRAAPPLEAIILFIGGMALAITGAILFAASRGVLPYYENGFLGLLLVMFALQTMVLGKTPFGDMRRSKPLLAGAVAIAAAGIVACFIPTFGRIPRWLLFLCFGPGGLFLFLRMCISRDKLRAWARFGGIFRHLIAACSAVYILSMISAVFLLTQGALAAPVTAAALLVYGFAVFYLAAVLTRIYRDYPGSERGPGSEGISAEQAMLLLMGVFMLLLGILLIPVNRGLVPFSGSAQIGLLMLIFAVQMLASGSTPIGPFPRSRLVIAFGLLFAALGILSSIVPGILVAPLTVLVGVLNILGGIMGLIRTLAPRLKSGPPPLPLLRRLLAVQVALNMLSMTFGTSMLVPGLVPGLAIGLILAANGGVLLYLLGILVALERLQKGAAAAA